jgi:hypothetical protein
MTCPFLSKIETLDALKPLDTVQASRQKFAATFSPRPEEYSFL